MNINEQVARRLDEVAELLEEQGANLFRVQAYRRGAETVRRRDRPVQEIFEKEGMDGLCNLPDVGDRSAIAIRDLLTTGRLPMLDRPRGATDPVDLFETVPGIGPVQAARLHDELGLDSLEDLESAAHDGRLSEVAGLGRKRVAGIIDSLATRLGRARPPGSHSPDQARVEKLLDIDREYRELASAGKLPKITPHRFNPSHAAWLPVLHVITSQFGPLKNKRIVRGREEECADH